MWEADEEMALALAWIDSSEDSIEDDGKHSPEFWVQILTKFFALMGRVKYRGNDSVYNKWKSLRTKITDFTGVHTRVVNNKKSGISDADVLEACLKQYKALYKTDFSMLDIWRQCISSPKWHLVSTSSPPRLSKRLKTTSTSANQSPSQPMSDGRYQLNLNELDPELIFDELDELPRPVGRDKG
ncbi:glutathione S-transferase T3-like [Bidens hawaiensis]|uniref:glutathione S-transferase T3-like n=1 Tax=Bidens hawaiensis TaxID=980011 RepID=UPI00404A0A83